MACRSGLAGHATFSMDGGRKVARPGRFELPTLCLEGRRSIQLSYGRNRIDSKTFAPRRHTVLDALTLRVEGRRSGLMSHVCTPYNLPLPRILRRDGPISIQPNAAMRPGADGAASEESFFDSATKGACCRRKRPYKSGANHILQETICPDSSLLKLSWSFCLSSPCQGQYQFV